MEKFLNKNFLLNTPTAEKLYNERISKLPIIDLYSVFSAKEIAENCILSNISEIWIDGNEYVRDVMRHCGVEEKYISGSGSDFEKFREFCKIMPLLMGNPVYYWCHWELCNYFDCTLIINADNCEKIWEITAEKLEIERLGVKDWIVKSNCELVFVVDDPTDDLNYHGEINPSESKLNVLSVCCPDKGFDILDPGFSDYICNLGKITGVEITDYASLCSAYMISLDRFDSVGCKVAFSVLKSFRKFTKPDIYHANQIFVKALETKSCAVSNDDADIWRAQMMRFFGLEFVKRGWIWRFGIDNCSRDFNSFEFASLFEYLYKANALHKIEMYSSNLLSCVELLKEIGIGSGSKAPGFAYGSLGGLYNCIDEVELLIKKVAGKFALGTFLGFFDSAIGFTASAKQDYFRRILCKVIGEWIEQGHYADYDSAADIAARIAGYNALNFYDMIINK